MTTRRTTLKKPAPVAVEETESGINAPVPEPVLRAPSYVKGSHTARVKAEQDERRVELLALSDVLSAQRDALNDQIADIGQALMLLSEPAPSNVVPMEAAE